MSAIAMFVAIGCSAHAPPPDRIIGSRSDAGPRPGDGGAAPDGAVVSVDTGPATPAIDGGPAGEMVLVPAGAFMMGCNASADSACEANESPFHSVMLSAFTIDRIEVTQGDYQACLDAGACTETPTVFWDSAAHPRWPVTNVSWNGATAYCAWKGKRLPTEAEWEKAARGEDARVYPWGNTPVPRCGVNADFFELADGACDPSPMDVASFPGGASPYGVLDMAGSVWEWVSDWYAADTYSTAPTSDPTGPASGMYKSARGGGFQSSDARQLRASFRGFPWTTPSTAPTDTGFRCAAGEAGPI